MSMESFNRMMWDPEKILADRAARMEQDYGMFRKMEEDKHKRALELQGSYDERAADTKEMQGTFNQKAALDRELQGTFGEKSLLTKWVNQLNANTTLAQYDPKKNKIKAIELEQAAKMYPYDAANKAYSAYSNLMSGEYYKNVLDKAGIPMPGRGEVISGIKKEFGDTSSTGYDWDEYLKGRQLF